jgi:hypothetical protein
VTRPPRPGRQDSRSAHRDDSGGRYGYLFAAIGVGTALLLAGVTLLIALRPPDPDAQQPSMSLEEATAESGTGAELDGVAAPGAPGFDPVQAALVANEDQRIFRLVEGKPPDSAPRLVTWPRAMPTLVLPARPTPYTVADLQEAGAVTLQHDGGLLVTTNVLVGPGADVSIQVPNGRLRLSSTPTGFTSLVAVRGSLELSGAPGAPLSVTSWDPQAKASDSDLADGRAYVRSVGGRLELKDVNASALGFWSGRTGGIAWTGSTTAPATGAATAVTTSGNFAGLVIGRSVGVLVSGAQVTDSTGDGVVVRTAAADTQLLRVLSTDNGRNGVRVSTGATNTSLREVTATGNQCNGIYLDGTPRTPAPTAPGDRESPALRATGLSIETSSVRDNDEHGVLAINPTLLELTNTEISDNQDGVIIRGSARGVLLRGNTVSSPGGFAVAINGGAEAGRVSVERNVLHDALAGVQVTDTTTSIIGNDIRDMTVHGVAFIGRADRSAVTENRIAGRGPSAIDTNRLAPGAVVNESSNDESLWKLDRDSLRYVAALVRTEPLVLLWAVPPFVPLILGIAYLRRRRAEYRYRHR